MGRRWLLMALVCSLPLSAAAISRDEILAEGQRWVDAGVPYSQGSYGSYCAWGYYYFSPGRGDTYRPDCSGYVSAMWGLPGEGRSTWGFAPADGSVSYAISWEELQPGDALNLYDTHMMLFGGWLDFGAGSFWVYETGTCGTNAHTSTRRRWDDPYWGNMEATFVPIRLIGVDDGGVNQGPAPDACGGLDYIGTCEGDTLRWCESGRLRSYDCAAAGKWCGWQDDQTGFNCLDFGAPAEPPPAEPPPAEPPPAEPPPAEPPPAEPPPADPCNGLDYIGVCDGSTLWWCENGGLRTADCAALGKVCGWQDDQVGWNCLAPPPPDDCGGLDYAGFCDAAVLTWCEGGQVRVYDCGAVGMACGWQDDAIGNNCLAAQYLTNSPSKAAAPNVGPSKTPLSPPDAITGEALGEGCSQAGGPPGILALLGLLAWLLAAGAGAATGAARSARSPRARGGAAALRR